MRLRIIDVQRCVGCQLCMLACSRRQNQVGIANTCIGVRSNGGMEHGFKVVACRACPDPPCARVCPNDALKVRKGGGVIFNKTKCIGCKSCYNACIIGAVYWCDETNKPQICIHCGNCVDFCPHGVLALDKGRNVYKEELTGGCDE